ncbi:MAG TPA: GNAT family N-acetyltransferase [Bryobacteraceae bacterium]|nr:GNAT family N-acetyltransferase [Bryobacteraceae bacterium]
MDPLFTSRLVLRELAADDIDFLAGMLADTEVMRYWPAPLTRAEAETWIDNQQKRYARDGCGYWLAARRETGEPVGQAGVLMLDWTGESLPALGYMIHRPFWRMGYATEAARACCDFIWNALRQQTVYTLIRPENEASLAVARKLGMSAGEHIQYHGFEHVVFRLDHGFGL